MKMGHLQAKKSRFLLGNPLQTMGKSWVSPRICIPVNSGKITLEKSTVGPKAAKWMDHLEVQFHGEFQDFFMDLR